MCHFMKILRLILYYISRISRADFDLSMRIAHIGTNYVSILVLVTFLVTFYVSGGWVDWGFDFTCQKGLGLALAARERVC